MKKKVLVIDDNADFLNMLKNTFRLLLRDTDLEFSYFISYLDLLEYYEEHMSDIGLVVSDYTMPGMNGGDLYSTLKIMDSNLKFILVTGGADVDLSNYSLKPNIVGVYEKPIESVVYFAKEIVRIVLEEE